ncbi:hypothetical protein Tco_1464956 [Tanacetum coccineum]
MIYGPWRWSITLNILTMMFGSIGFAEFIAVEKAKGRQIPSLLMAIPKEHLRKGLEKGLWKDSNKKLLSQLEAHGAEVSTEDTNHKFLRSLPLAWVFEQELTSTSKSSVSAQNVTFVSHSKSSTNKVKSGHTGAFSIYTPTSSNNIPEREVPAGFANEIDVIWTIRRVGHITGQRIAMIAYSILRKFLQGYNMDGDKYWKMEDSFYQDQEAGKKEHNQNCLLNMDDGVVNWGEHTEKTKK